MLDFLGLRITSAYRNLAPFFDQHMFVTLLVTLSVQGDYLPLQVRDWSSRTWVRSHRRFRIALCEFRCV